MTCCCQRYLRETPAIARLVLVTVLFAGSGCSTLRPGSDGVVHDLTPLHPSLPAVERYGARTAVAEGDMEDDRRTFLRSLPREQAALFTYDPTLSPYARVVVFAGLSAQQPISEVAAAWLRWRLGIGEAGVTAVYAWATGATASEMLFDSVVRWAKERRDTARVRFAFAQLDSGRRRGIGLVVVRDSVALDPLPMRVAAGDEVLVRGRLLEKIHAPRLIVVDGPDAARSIVPKVAEDGTFSVPVKLNMKGRALLELRGGLPGPEPDQVASSLFLVPIGVDGPPFLPALDELAGAGAVPGTPFTTGALGEAIARRREQTGLAPLVRDPAADAALCRRDVAARDHDFREATAFLAPLPPTGVQSWWGSYRSMADLQWSVATSPSLALAIARHTHLAICVSPDDDRFRVRYGLWGTGAMVPRAKRSSSPSSLSSSSPSSSPP